MSKQLVMVKVRNNGKISLVGVMATKQPSSLSLACMKMEGAVSAWWADATEYAMPSLTKKVARGDYTMADFELE